MGLQGGKNLSEASRLHLLKTPFHNYSKRLRLDWEVDLRSFSLTKAY
jgi:hypothetical protein